MFVRTIDLTDEDMKKVSKLSGRIMAWCIEGRSTAYMAEHFVDLQPWQIEHNIDEMLYELRKHVGLWRYIKILFRK